MDNMGRSTVDEAPASEASLSAAEERQAAAALAAAVEALFQAETDYLMSPDPSAKVLDVGMASAHLHDALEIWKKRLRTPPQMRLVCLPERLFENVWAANEASLMAAMFSAAADEARKEVGKAERELLAATLSAPSLSPRPEESSSPSEAP